MKDKLVQKITDLQEQIETAKTNKSRTEGRIEQLKAQLLEKFGCKTVEQAQTKLEKMEKSIKVKEKKLEKMVNEFEQTFLEKMKNAIQEED